MSVTPSIQSHFLQLLARVLPAVRVRRMFGEVGLYSGETFFALIADDVLYFKVDDATRGAFEARGMPPFRPYGDDRASMSYFQVPEEILEDTDALREWGGQAVAAAGRKQQRKPRKTQKSQKAQKTPKLKQQEKGTSGRSGTS